MRSIALFCGSSLGHDPRFRDAAGELGRTVAERGLRLVYGGGAVGLMGVAADGALAAGGVVIGVIPQFLLELEVGHGALSELVVVASMHERKAVMAERADAFVALPGGIGTLEELFEIWTWTQLGIHTKRCGLLNVGGYFDPLLAFLDRAVEEGFVSAANRELLQVGVEPGELVDRLLSIANSSRKDGLGSRFETSPTDRLT